MAKRKRMSEEAKLAKTQEQLDLERRRKRRQTLVRKSLALLRDCGSHVYMVIEELDGRCYKYNTRGSNYWLPSDDGAESMNDPILDNDIVNIGTYSNRTPTPEPTPAPMPTQPETRTPFLQPPTLEKSPVTQAPAFRFK